MVRRCVSTAIGIYRVQIFPGWGMDVNLWIINKIRLRHICKPNSSTRETDRLGLVVVPALEEFVTNRLSVHVLNNLVEGKLKDHHGLQC